MEDPFTTLLGIIYPRQYGLDAYLYWAFNVLSFRTPKARYRHIAMSIVIVSLWFAFPSILTIWTLISAQDLMGRSPYRNYVFLFWSLPAWAVCAISFTFLSWLYDACVSIVMPAINRNPAIKLPSELKILGSLLFGMRTFVVLMGIPTLIYVLLQLQLYHLCVSLVVVCCYVPLSVCQVALHLGRILEHQKSPKGAYEAPSDRPMEAPLDDQDHFVIDSPEGSENDMHEK